MVQDSVGVDVAKTPSEMSLEELREARMAVVEERAEIQASITALNTEVDQLVQKLNGIDAEIAARFGQG